MCKVCWFNHWSEEVVENLKVDHSSSYEAAGKTSTNDGC